MPDKKQPPTMDSLDSDEASRVVIVTDQGETLRPVIGIPDEIHTGPDQLDWRAKAFELAEELNAIEEIVGRPDETDPDDTIVARVHSIKSELDALKEQTMSQRAHQLFVDLARRLLKLLEAIKRRLPRKKGWL